MLVLSWNARGLGRLEKRRVVRSWVTNFKPVLLFIQESKLAVFDSVVIRSLGWTTLSRGMGVEAVGSAGGLISLWNEDLFCGKACTSNSRCIILVGELMELKKMVVVCNIYAANTESGRKELWDFLCREQSSFLFPWVFGGDFNTVFDPSERRGRGCIMSSVICFNSFILSSKVVDIPLLGMQFTWTNHWEKEVLSWFPKLVQRGIHGSLSDHNAIMIGEPKDNWGPSPFRFYNVWIEDKKLMDMAREGWMNCKDHFKNVKWQRPKIFDLPLKGLSIYEKEGLELEFTKEEVLEALNSCDGNKALGLDGMNLSFIQANYEMIEEDFMKFIGEFYYDSSIVRELNCTFVAFIPKCGRMGFMSDYIPISLVGLMYKVLANLLANKIKKVMASIIGEYQMAFVKELQILDSFIVAMEIIHEWKKNKEGGLLSEVGFREGVR
ncbi:hypothetical protein Dsin_029481 [Dipteronia sinensis]|uniref:Endonuclease/exonuclease/phosphatase domain-containing protein n=1 Tax=Dipteronia sinensis TaxID=43782 RepID=A0AAD9ZT64_9ROSI|nr:hypothetical protein Dsin_029481 [Dipteronia sinensis]